MTSDPTPRTLALMTPVKMTKDGELVSTRAFSVPENACLDAASATVTEDATSAATHAATTMRRLAIFDPLFECECLFGRTYISSGALTPKSSSDCAITRWVWTDSASRNDSSGVPTTLQSR